MVLKSTNSNFGKSDGRNRRNSGTWGGPRRSLGPETPAPPRGEAGMASCLASTCGWGPPARRRRAEIPDLIAINQRWKLPQSWAPSFAGNSPGSRLPPPNSRGFPGKSRIPGNRPGNPASRELGNPPLNYPWNFAGNWKTRPTSREISLATQQPEKPPLQFPGKLRRGRRVSLFPHSAFRLNCMSIFRIPPTRILTY